MLTTRSLEGSLNFQNCFIRKVFNVYPNNMVNVYDIYSMTNKKQIILYTLILVKFLWLVCC